MPSSKKVANRQLTHSASLRYAPFLRRLFAFTSKLAGSSARQATHARTMQAQSGQSLHASASLRYAVAFRFVSCLFPHVGQSSFKKQFIFRRQNWNYSKHWSWRLYGSSFCKSRQTFLSSTSCSVNEKCIGLVSQLKTAGTQKVFPLSPLRTPLYPLPKK